VIAKWQSAVPRPLFCQNKFAIPRATDFIRTEEFVQNRTEADIRDWCMAYLARTFKLPPEGIDPQAKFARLGMDSAASVFFIVELEEWLGLELAAESVFEYPTPTKLARYVAERYAAKRGAASKVD
jgi:acyl carrier protein